MTSHSGAPEGYMYEEAGCEAVDQHVECCQFKAQEK